MKMKLKELYELVYYTGESGRFVEFVGYDDFTHFTDGPAYIEDTGYKEWWVNGRYVYKGKLG